MGFLRLWSIHPKYLDKKGLIALWREGLLAKKVLEGKTIGYKNHPQLIRFKNFKDPLFAINAYLTQVYFEGKRRNYDFKRDKIKIILTKRIIPIKEGQIIYEYEHLLKKLKKRDKRFYKMLKEINKKRILLNPVFYKIKGNGKEFWEK
ncbi:MAG: pyrimidine dimer DNA glycosylase/endonuclease V [Candidatus Woesearchaeota archaeon]